jgi:hypothetical protein
MDIRPGDALQAFAYLVGAAGFIAAMRVSIARLAVRQDNLERVVATVVQNLSDSVKQITDAVTRMARYDERIRYLRRDVEELRRKQGYIARPEPLQNEDAAEQD